MDSPHQESRPRGRFVVEGEDDDIDLRLREVERTKAILKERASTEDENVSEAKRAAEQELERMLADDVDRVQEGSPKHPRGGEGSGTADSSLPLEDVPMAGAPSTFLPGPPVADAEPQTATEHPRSELDPEWDAFFSLDDTISTSTSSQERESERVGGSAVSGAVGAPEPTTPAILSPSTSELLTRVSSLAEAPGLGELDMSAMSEAERAAAVDIVRAIEQLPPSEREEAALGFENWNLIVKKFKGRIIDRAVSTVPGARKIEFIDAWARTFNKEYLFAKRDTERIREEKENGTYASKGWWGQSKNIGYLYGTAAKFVRPAMSAAGFIGWPYKLWMLGALTAAREAEAGVEVSRQRVATSVRGMDGIEGEVAAERLHTTQSTTTAMEALGDSEEARRDYELTAHEVLPSEHRAAYDEAWRMYEEARENSESEKATKETLDAVYVTHLPQELKERIALGSEDEQRDWLAERLQQKVTERIEAMSREFESVGSTEAREELAKKHRALLEKYDSIIDATARVHVAAVRLDRLASAGKPTVAGLAIETGVRGGWALAGALKYWRENVELVPKAEAAYVEDRDMAKAPPAPRALSSSAHEPASEAHSVAAPSLLDDPAPRDLAVPMEPALRASSSPAPAVPTPDTTSPASVLPALKSSTTAASVPSVEEMPPVNDRGASVMEPHPKRVPPSARLHPDITVPRHETRDDIGRPMGKSPVVSEKASILAPFDFVEAEPEGQHQEELAPRAKGAQAGPVPVGEVPDTVAMYPAQALLETETTTVRHETHTAVPPPPERMKLVVDKGGSPLKLARRLYMERAAELGYRGDVKDAAALGRWAERVSTRHIVGQWLVEHARDSTEPMMQKFFENDEHQQLLARWRERADRSALETLVQHLRIWDFNDIVQNKVPSLALEGGSIELDESGNVLSFDAHGNRLLGHVAGRRSTVPDTIKEAETVAPRRDVETVRARAGDIPESAEKRPHALETNVHETYSSFWERSGFERAPIARSAAEQAGITPEQLDSREELLLDFWGKHPEVVPYDSSREARHLFEALSRDPVKLQDQLSFIDHFAYRRESLPEAKQVFRIADVLAERVASTDLFRTILSNYEAVRHVADTARQADILELFFSHGVSKQSLERLTLGWNRTLFRSVSSSLDEDLDLRIRFSVRSSMMPVDLILYRNGRIAVDGHGVDGNWPARHFRANALPTTEDSLREAFAFINRADGHGAVLLAPER